MYVESNKKIFGQLSLCQVQGRSKMNQRDSKEKKIKQKLKNMFWMLARRFVAKMTTAPEPTEFSCFLFMMRWTIIYCLVSVYLPIVVSSIDSS